MAPRTALLGLAACCRRPAARGSLWSGGAFVTALAATTTATATATATATTTMTATTTTTMQTRSAGILASLRDNPGAHQKRIRVGRGASAGKGKTAGRGHKGQKQHGKVKPWFQGGQTPLVRTWGHKGFINHRADTMSEVNLDRLQAFVDAGRLDATKPITPKELIQSGLVGRVRDGIKILGRGAGALRTPVDLLVSRASAGAIEAVEAAGGRVVTRYFTQQSIRWLLQGTCSAEGAAAPLPTGPEHVEAAVAALRRAPQRRRLPDPTSRWDLEYYRDPAHRGYLSHQLQPGESPSLFFKVPAARRVVRAGTKVVQRKKAEDSLF